VNKFRFIFLKNFVRQNFFVAERRMRIARRFNGGKANQKMRVPTGRKKIFSISAPDFLPPLRGLEIFAIESRS
jgi:hypothetical protein